jgi:hypothetical protein
MAESDIEAIPLDDGSSKTGLIVGVVAAGSLIFGLGIGHIVSWESLFNFTFGSVLMLPLTEAMLSVSSYLFIPYTTTMYIHLFAQCIYDLAGIRQTLHRNLDGGSSVYQN